MRQKTSLLNSDISQQLAPRSLSSLLHNYVILPPRDSSCPFATPANEGDPGDEIISLVNLVVTDMVLNRKANTHTPCLWGGTWCSTPQTGAVKSCLVQQRGRRCKTGSLKLSGCITEPCLHEY